MCPLWQHHFQRCVLPFHFQRWCMQKKKDEDNYTSAMYTETGMRHVYVCFKNMYVCYIMKTVNYIGTCSVNLTLFVYITI